MNNLVVTVSLDSSIHLLKSYADIVVLDESPEFNCSKLYDTLYIRSHFSHPALLPQNFHHQINEIVHDTKRMNPEIKCIDSMETVDAMVSFEDKWNQYQGFGRFMPYTELFEHGGNIGVIKNPVYKKRLSSRGSGTTWSQEKALDSDGSWIIQESLNINEELRIYVIYGEVYPIGITRSPMKEGRKAESLAYKKLTQDEIDFTLAIMFEAPGLDVAGLDIARTDDGRLNMLEVNRSPGFAKFFQITDVNLARHIFPHS